MHIKQSKWTNESQNRNQKATNKKKHSPNLGLNKFLKIKSEVI